MATADELIIRIRADMRDIERKLDGLERESGQTSRTMQRHFQRAAQGINNAFRNIRGPAIAATAAGTAFAFMAQQSLEAVEAISDLSTRANVSAEFLQEMRFAINQSGGSARDFDDAISRLNRRFGLFLQNLRTGEGEAGPAAAAFRALGLETRIVSGELTDAEGVFNAAVEGLSEVESAAQRSALASQLFGEDSGPRLVALLDRGIGGINRLREAARAAGVVLSDDLVEAGAAASDQLEIMQLQIETGFNRAIVENSEDLQVFARNIADVATAAIEAAAAMTRFGVDTANALGEFGQFLRLIPDPERDVVRAIDPERAADAYQRAAAMLEGPSLNVSDLLETLRSAGTGAGNQLADDLMAALEGNMAPDYAAMLIELNELAARSLALASMAAVNDVIQYIRNGEFFAGLSPAEAGGGGGGGGGGAAREAAPALPGAYDPFANSTSGSVAGAFVREGNLGLTIEEAMKRAGEAVEDTREELSALDIQVQGLADGAVKNLEDAFVDFVRTGRFEVASLVDFMIEQFARLAFQNTIGSALDGLFGSIFGAVLGGPAGAAAGLASGISGKIAGAPALQVAAAGSQARSMTMASGRAITISQPITIDARGADAGVEDRIRRIFADQGPALQQQTMRATIEAIGRINSAGRVQN